MHPILLTFGSWEIHSYGFILFLAIVLGVVVFWHEARRVEFPTGEFLTFLAGAIAFGLMGGRLNAWLFHLRRHFLLPNLNITSLHGGLTSFGSIAGALAFGSFYARRHHWHVWAFLDLLAPAIPLIEGVMRWGCLLNGCCHGRQTDSFLGMYLPGLDGRWANRYPTQVILSVFCLALFAYLWRRRCDRSFDGVLILSYLVIYHVGRFAIDALRGDQQIVAGLLTIHQLTSVTFVAIATAVMVYRGEEAQQRCDPSSDSHDPNRQMRHFNQLGRDND